MKTRIGIVPPAALFETDMPHKDRFSFGNPYVQQITKQGTIPLGILSMDGYVLEDTLDICDGFLLAGGTKIWPYHLQVVEHALRKQKPLLGICLGMQAIAAYFQIQHHSQGKCRDIVTQFEKMKHTNFMFNHPVKHHYLEEVTRGTTKHSKHPIIISRNTRLFEAIGKTSASGVSLHSYRIAPPVEELTVSAHAPDGTIEGIEYEGYLVGVQFHPEVEEQWAGLFHALSSGDWVH